MKQHKIKKIVHKGVVYAVGKLVTSIEGKDSKVVFLDYVGNGVCSVDLADGSRLVTSNAEIWMKKEQE